ncbi:MAG: TolC family protein [Chitinophagaceae bacterium]
MNSYLKWGRKIIVLATMINGLFFSVMAQTQPREKNDTGIVKHYNFSVLQAIDFAAKNNVQVKNALLDIKSQKEINREFTAAAYPHINASLGTTYNASIATQVLPNFISPSTYQVLIDEGVKDGSGNPIQIPSNFGFIAAQFGTKYNASAGVSLNQLLFDGQVFVGLQARATAIEWKNKQVAVTEEVIRANIYKIYYQLVVGKTQIELLDATIDRLNKLLKDTRIIYENGFAEKLDVDKVSVQLNNLQTEKNKIANSISNGYYGLKTLMGMPVKDELVLTDTISDASIKEGMLENNTYSYEERKDFQYAQLGKKLGEFNIRRYKLSLIPTISVNGSYAKNAQRNKFNFFQKGDWFSISAINLNISIPIFNGFATQAKINQAKIDLQKVENQIDALKLSIDNEVTVSRNNFNIAIQSLDFQKKNMALAEAVYMQTKKKYEAGTGSQLEINGAQVDLKGAQSNYITSLYDAIIAKVDYFKAIGKL